VKAYRDFAFHIVYHELLQFCTVTLSAFYLDILKDRLYCSAPASPERRAAQTVLQRLVDAITRLMAPVLPFTAEEVWANIPGPREASVHFARFPEPSGTEEPQLLERWEKLRALREVVNKALEEARKRGEIGKSLEAAIRVVPPPGDMEGLLRAYEAELPALFIVSRVELAPAEEGGPRVEVVPASGEKCARCWTVAAAPVAHEGGPLCPRCASVVSTS
jgi:isoleucyl-tRNA synthetase